MIIKYNFKDDADTYNFEISYIELEKVLIEILCDKVKSINGKTYNEEGARQMALFVVNTVDCDELALYFEEELEIYFYNKAYCEWKTQVENYEEDRRWGW